MLYGNIVWAGAVSIVGQLDPNDAQDVFRYPFTLSAPATLAIQSWGHGGTSSAPGGTNARGNPIAAGGFDPYVSVFSGTGPGATFVASNDDGACPPGTPAAGACRDATLSLPLPAGTYTLAVSTFENMSFAENLGNGTLADGFIGLGSFGGRTNAFAVDLGDGGAGALVVPTLALGYVPNALTFGAQTLNTTSGPLTVTVTNTGTGPVALGALGLGGSNPGEFGVGGDCTGSLAAGATCVIAATFKPTAAGLRVATLSLNSNAPGSPALINLQGTGTNSLVATAALTATDLDFGSQPVGTASSPRTLVVTDTGGAPLVIGIDSEGGANAAEFALVDGCAGQTLAAGASCSVTVVFRPVASRSRSATLTINSNASNNPVTVTLRGSGFVPTIPALGNGALLVLALGVAAAALPMRRRLRAQARATRHASGRRRPGKES